MDKLKELLTCFDFVNATAYTNNLSTFELIKKNIKYTNGLCNVLYNMCKLN